MTTTLKAEPREQIGKNLNQLRDKNWIPAILYGHKTQNQNLKIELHSFNQAFKAAGQTSLIDLEVSSPDKKDKTEVKPVKILIHDIQYNPITDEVIHLDLYKVNMSEKIRTEIPVITVGESPAVKDLEGSLLLNISEVEIECLPGDLIQEIQIDISNLKTFDDKVLVSNLKVPETITVLNDTEETVALINPPRSEEELEALNEEVEENVEGVEVTTAKPVEGVEGEAGEEGVEKPADTPSSEDMNEKPTEKPKE